MSENFSVAQAAGKQHSLSILVPALNEEGNLTPTVDSLLRSVRPLAVDFEIIIVNDGSTDGTADEAERLAAQHDEVRCLHNDRCMGLGFSYMRGVDSATKSHFIYVPGDNTWPKESFDDLLSDFGRYDIITSFNTNPEVRDPGRRVVSAMYTRCVNLLFGYRMKYYNGLTIYPRAFLTRKPIQTYGFGFQAEALLKALDSGYSVVEVALPLDPRTVGKSKAVTVKNIASCAYTLTRLFWELRIGPRNRWGAGRAER
jgi:glycosyltransferase involved in cell wall biosynthesis